MRVKNIWIAKIYLKILIFSLCLTLGAIAQKTETPVFRQGLYVMYPIRDSNQNLTQLKTALANNPYITGALLHTKWSILESQKGNYDYNKLDSAISILGQLEKKYALAISGALPPTYVYELGAEKFNYLDDNPHHGARYLTSLSMPLPWDSTWQHHYEKLLRTIGERYSTDSNCQSIVLTCSRTMEMHFPRRPEELEKWKEYNNYKERIANAYIKLMDVLADAFPNQQIVLMVSQMFNKNDSSGHSDEQIISKIIDHGLKHYPNKFTLQTNQLDGRRDNNGKFSYDIITRYKNQLHIGFQSVASFRRTTERQGSMEMAVFNYLQAKAEYWELWRGDGIDAETCRKLTEILNLASQMGVDAYKKKLIAEGKFLKPEDDSYSLKVKERREKAIREWKAKQHQ